MARKSDEEVSPRDFADEIAVLTGRPVQGRDQSSGRGREHDPRAHGREPFSREQYIANMSYKAQVVLECAGCGFLYKKQFTTGRSEEDRIIRCYMEEFKCSRCGSVRCTVAARVGWK